MRCRRRRDDLGTSQEEPVTRNATILVSAAMLSVALLSGDAGAYGMPQTVDLAKVDVQTLAAGYRPSKIIGTNAVNDVSETIGEIADVLVGSDGKQPYAVLSIGGFLGMGNHLVVVPCGTLKLGDKR